MTKKVKTNARAALKKQLIDLSNSDVYATAVNEWIFDSYKYGTNKCACGNTIMHCYTMRNIVNGNRMVVGSTCMPKYFYGRNDIKHLIGNIIEAKNVYSQVMKCYGKLVDNQYVWTDECDITITDYDKKYKRYNIGVWSIPNNFWRIIRIIMDKDVSHSIFDTYEARFLSDMLWDSSNFVHKTEKQQKFFLSIFTSKVMPILYDWYGPVKADN